MADPQAAYKQEAGERAAALVQPGMAVGLGTGSTAIFATRRIAERLRAGELPGMTGYPTSERVRAEALRLGIPLLPDDLPRPLDLTIDGADEADPALNLIKGGGGALLREKIAAQASRRVVIVVDETKLSERLGTRRALPVEVVPFGWRSQARFLEEAGARVALRAGADGAPFTTDQENYVLDCAFGPILDPVGLAARLGQRAGIVAHGLFLGLATDLIVAGPEGVRVVKREDG